MTYGTVHHTTPHPCQLTKDFYLKVWHCLSFNEISESELAKARTNIKVGWSSNQALIDHPNANLLDVLVIAPFIQNLFSKMFTKLNIDFAGSFKSDYSSQNSLSTLYGSPLVAWNLCNIVRAVATPKLRSNRREVSHRGKLECLPQRSWSPSYQSKSPQSHWYLFVYIKTL